MLPQYDLSPESVNIGFSALPRAPKIERINVAWCSQARAFVANGCDAEERERRFRWVMACIETAAVQSGLELVMTVGG